MVKMEADAVYIKRAMIGNKREYLVPGTVLVLSIVIIKYDIFYYKVI